MYEADYALKRSGHDEIFDHIPGYIPRSAKQSLLSLLTPPKASVFYSRAWFEPKRVEIEVSTNGGLLSFGKSEMILKKELIKVNAESQEDERKLRAMDEQETKHINDNFDVYAQGIPAWHSLREAAKVIALARWLKRNAKSINLDGVTQTRWDNPGQVPVKFGRMFRYFLTKEKGSGAPVFAMQVSSGWAGGGIDFNRPNWTSEGPGSTVKEAKLADQLVISSQLGEKAVHAGKAGDLEGARYLAELSARALTGRITRSHLGTLGVGLPQARPTPLSSAGVALQVRLLQELIGGLSGATASGKPDTTLLSRIEGVYDQLRSEPVSASRFLYELQTRQTLPRPVETLAPGGPTPPARIGSQECRAAWGAMQAYRRALEEATLVAARLNLAILSEERRRREWEEMMDAAVERAHDRAGMLLFHLPLRLLGFEHRSATGALGRDLAWWQREVNLLPGAAGQRISEWLRAVTRISARDAKDFDELLSVLESVGTLRQRTQSPTAAAFLNSDIVQRSRAVFDILSTVARQAGAATELLEHHPTLRAAWERYNFISETQAYAQAMLDSWFDALSSWEAWNRLNEINLNADRYLEAVRKLQTEMRQRVARLEKAKQIYRERCTSANIPE
jgi:hypothetical protein